MVERPVVERTVVERTVVETTSGGKHTSPLNRLDANGVKNAYLARLRNVHSRKRRARYDLSTRVSVTKLRE